MTIYYNTKAIIDILIYILNFVYRGKRESKMLIQGQKVGLGVPILALVRMLALKSLVSKQ